MCVQHGKYGKVSGWGVTTYLGRSSRFLRKVTLPVVRFEDCTASTEQVTPPLQPWPHPLFAYRPTYYPL